MIITTFPYGNNEVPSTSALFEDRKAYYEHFIQKIKNNTSPITEQPYTDIPFADLFLDNAMYGLIDLNAHLIELKNPENTLVSISGINNRQFRILNFVADAYYDMRNYFKRAISLGKVQANSPMMQMVIHRGYIDLTEYTEILNDNLINKFKNATLEDKELSSKIIDHKSFVNEMNNFLFRNINNSVITRGSTCLKSNFLGFSSGLIFDISNYPADNDYNKWINYLDTKDFLVFSEACLRFGFRIDVTVPWRLIADINSPGMMRYMEKYNIKNINNLFNLYYKPIYLQEINNIKNSYYNFYNIFLINNEYYEKSYKKLCENQINENIVFKRERITKEKFFNDFKDDYWLRLYVYLKNYEFKRNLTQDEFENIVRESINYLKIKKVNNALTFIEKFFKDFNISLYYRLQKQTVEESLDDVTNSTYKNIVF